ncbi:MAG: deoxycytidylate deaminase [Methylobacterium sp.]|nr:deoxycytidylate deaminase [Methylobacterium sp.]MCA3624642.1 deoxycytidylate deaminase [Methylobacterium sp.]
MGFARHASVRSKDSTQVGAALVGPDGEVRLTGCNSPPRGVVDSPDRFESPKKYRFASHAEQNIIAFAAREGIMTRGCTIYVTHHPCSSCARSIIHAGITCVVTGDGKTSMEKEEFEAAAEMFAEAGVAVRSAIETE